PRLSAITSERAPHCIESKSHGAGCHAESLRATSTFTAARPAAPGTQSRHAQDAISRAANMRVQKKLIHARNRSSDRREAEPPECAVGKIARRRPALEPVKAVHHAR